MSFLRKRIFIIAGIGIVSFALAVATPKSAAKKSVLGNYSAVHDSRVVCAGAPPVDFTLHLDWKIRKKKATIKVEGGEVIKIKLDKKLKPHKKKQKISGKGKDRLDGEVIGDFTIDGKLTITAHGVDLTGEMFGKGVGEAKGCTHESDFEGSKGSDHSLTTRASSGRKGIFGK